MFKRSLIAASLSVAALVSAQAMAVNGGGATLPQQLYQEPGDRR
ncbi:protein disulfide reductase, partial [Pseudomonas aeruginosa]